MTPEQAQYLDEVEARAMAATPGPWGVSDDDYDYSVFQVEDPPQWGTIYVGQQVNQGEGKDAEFIAHSRTDVERLTALVRAFAGAWDEAVEYCYYEFSSGEIGSDDFFRISEKYGLDKLP